MARDFTGSPNDLSVADTAAWSPAGVFAVSAWVKRDTNTQGAVVAKWSSTSNRSFILFVDTSHVVQAVMFVNGGANHTGTKSGFTEGDWHQVGLNFRTGALISAVLDGVKGTEASCGGGINDSTRPTRIGSSADDGTTRYWDGAICDVAAWSTDLSNDEWAALAKGVPARMIRPDALLSYVPLWGVGSGEPDLSGNGNHFAVNGTLAQRDHGPIGCPFPVAA